MADAATETDETPSADGPPEADAPAAEAAAEPEPPEAVSTDALLSMFSTTEAEAEDISLILDLAGDVEIDDLLEQLNTIAAALGIDTSGREEIEYDEALAA